MSKPPTKYEVIKALLFWALFPIWYPPFLVFQWFCEPPSGITFKGVIVPSIGDCVRLGCLFVIAPIAAFYVAVKLLIGSI